MAKSTPMNQQAASRIGAAASHSNGGQIPAGHFASRAQGRVNHVAAVSRNAAQRGGGKEHCASSRRKLSTLAR